LAGLAVEHPEWPRLRVGEDTVNTGARLESLAPAGGVLIGPETYDRLPDCATVEERTGLRMKGKDDVLDAYVLLALPCCAGARTNRFVDVAGRPAPRDEADEFSAGGPSKR
jgi:hypothetical protein